MRRGDRPVALWASYTPTTSTRLGLRTAGGTSAAASGHRLLARKCHTSVILLIMRVVELLWDEHNEAHIARHSVIPAEVEEVVFARATRWELQTSHHRPRLIAVGPTGAGRLLFVVCELPTPAGRSVCVTARPATARERRVFEERSRG